MLCVAVATQAAEERRASLEKLKRLHKVNLLSNMPPVDLQEALTKTNAPRPDLSAMTSPALTTALQNPETLWQFIIAPDTPYPERLAATLRGKDVLPTSWFPTVLAAKRELEREQQRHNWGLWPHPLWESTAIVDWTSVAERERDRLILGHPWRVPTTRSPYPLSWDEETRAPWPWQAQQAVQILWASMKSSGDASKARTH